MKITITQDELRVVEAQWREAQASRGIAIPDGESPDGVKVKPPEVVLSLQQTLSDLGQKYGYEPRTANIDMNSTSFEALPDARMIAQLVGAVGRILDLWTDGKALEFTEILVYFGFLQRTKYDPKVHGEAEGSPAPGEEIFAVSPRGMTLLNSMQRVLDA